MRTIIAGSRSVTDYRTIVRAIQASGIRPTAVVSGTARGVDQLGERWAESNELPVHRYPADWDTHGRRAGYLRNVLMSENADALIAVWDGQSKGTKHMIDIADRKGLKVFVYRTDER